MPISNPRFDLRSGVTEPVLLLISRRQIETGDMPSVLNELKILTAAREDIWLYRGQMSMVIDGFDGDPRELVDIHKVRTFLREFATAWPYWAFFFNQVDDSLILLASCCCGDFYPGGGLVEIDTARLKKFLLDGFAAMNALFDKHGFPESELEIQSRGVLELIEQAGLA